MQCQRCKTDIPKGEERELHGQCLCEDCYIDLLSPLKACDPWAVHSAQSFSKSESPVLTPIQERIIAVLKKNGPTEPKDLSGMFELDEKDLEREIAILRHMERVRGELRDGKKVIRLW